MDRVYEAEPTGGFRHSFLVQAWLVLFLAVCFGAALAFVQLRLGSVIAANRQNETLRRIPELIWGPDGAAYMTNAKRPVSITPGFVTVEKTGKQAHYAVFRVDRGETLAGWVIRSGGQGYADRIEVLIGLAPDAAIITGLFVLEQKETPGLGAKVATAKWRGQFAGKSTGKPLALTKTGSGAPRAIDAVTGATISSRSVTGIVNRAVKDLRRRLTPETLRPKTGEAS